jgi:hypothetical protein
LLSELPREHAWYGDKEDERAREARDPTKRLFGLVAPNGKEGDSCESRKQETESFSIEFAAPARFTKDVAFDEVDLGGLGHMKRPEAVNYRKPHQ